MQIQNLTMAYGDRILFEEVTFNLNPGHRYGVVGANGAGKTTFLDIIVGNTKPNDGEIVKAKDVAIGFMKQDQFLYDDYRILDVVIAGKEALFNAFKRKDALLKEENWGEAEAIELAELEAEIARSNGYSAEADAAILLSGLGIAAEYHEEPLSTLSGGFKLRVLLAQLLYQAPEVMLLDEPTNHLDINTIAWLEQYIIDNYTGVVLFISHDRMFLNRLATDILDVDYQTITLYPGNHDDFEVKKQENYLLNSKIRENQEKKIAHMQEYVDRFRYKASKAKQAQSKLKQIDKIELKELYESSRISPKFAFHYKTKTGKQIVKIKSLSKSFGDNDVLNDVSFDIFRGDKIAVVGANGRGKSTLLKILVEKFKADSGEIDWGSNINISYFAQDHHEELNESKTVLEWLTDNSANVTSQGVRNMLGQVLFTKDDVEKNILSLSGGEAARLLLANIMLNQGNVIILDEPTNHLDMEAVTALSKALQQTEATVIVVSHDRYFLDQFANRVISLKPRGLIDLKDSVKNFMLRYQDSPSEQLTQQKEKTKVKPVKKEKPKVVDNSHKIKKIEQKIHDLEASLETVHEALSNQSIYDASEKEALNTLTLKEKDITEKLGVLYKEWETLEKE